jgi:SpoVK/Ycf46/Vps4 family AAA+-type ATPase
MEKRFKFRSLQTFCNNEWMVNNQKRYRSVFDSEEVDYVRIELALYNKCFDEVDWNTSVQLKCINTSNQLEYCHREIDLMVRKEDHIFYVRDGWGIEQKGTFWKKGTYKWVAYVEGELVGERTFYINEVGQVDTLSNPYLQIDSIRLYNSGLDGWKDTERHYLKQFRIRDTQYVWVEVKFRNKTPKDYHYEFFLNFYDDAGQSKANLIHTGYTGANKDGAQFIFEKAWGSQLPGIWTDDRYQLEIVFNDVLIAATSFTCGDIEELGETPMIRTIEQTLAEGAAIASSPVQTDGVETKKSLEELMAELDALIGLEHVKKSIRQNITYLRFTKLRQEKGFIDATPISLHSIFTGNPGTGKTTVVKMLGKIYHQMGLLSKGHVVEADRASLVGEFIGQTAPKTKKMLESARGGILFIDEAYALARGDDDSKDFGREVIEILIKEMSDGPGDIAIIGAGYPKQIQQFIDSNPGLKSRISEYFHFEDYLPEELYQIARYAAQLKEVVFSGDADLHLQEQLTEAYRSRDDFFGNARFVHAVVDESKQNMGLRLMETPDLDSLSNEDISTILIDDLEPVFLTKQKKKLRLSINEKQLQDALIELNDLVGMEKIKDEVHELIQLIRFYNETGKDSIHKFSLHSVFTGNPGTGKTTLARIIGRIYKSLGILERGHVVEVDRESLVAGYVGQTATKTAAAIDKAMGGILFIDEAYALAGKNSGSDFGTEAIQVILKRMEDQRGSFGVIVAGYPEQMHLFIESNPGFKSRFDKTFEFPDYSASELWAITRYQLKKEGLTPDAEAEVHLLDHLHAMYDNRDKFFGNARSIRQLVADIVRKQNLRLASTPAHLRSKSDLGTLSLQDVKHLELAIESHSTLGFRLSR